MSLVFTVKNEAATIKGFLATVAAQQRLPDEVVVTDGGSTDGTREMLKEWAAGLAEDCRPRRFPRPVTVQRVRGNIARGRNAAVRIARHDIIACTDAGCELAPDWLARIAAPLEADPGLDVAAGGYRPIGLNLFERCAAAVSCPTRAIRADRFLPSARSVAFRRRAWARVGGFPEELDFAEDTAFDLALRQAGCRMRHTPEAAVAWRPRGSFRALARQFRNYARGDAQAGIRQGTYFRLYARWLAGAALLAAGLAVDARVLVPWALLVLAYVMLWARLRDWRGARDWRAPAIVFAQKLVVDSAAMLGWLEGRGRGKRSGGRAARRPGEDGTSSEAGSRSEAGGRVLLVGSRNLADPGGERRLVAVRAAALERRHGIATECLVVARRRAASPARDGQLRLEEVVASRGWTWPAALVRLALRARQRSREKGWRGVIVSGIGGLALVPFLRRWFVGLPLIADVHGAREEWLEYPPAVLARAKLARPAYRLARAVEGFALRRCDAALVVSDELGRHLRASHGPLRTLRVPCGVSGPVMPAPAAAELRARTRRRLGLDGRTTFVYCGGLSDWQCFREGVALWQAWLGRDARAALLVVTRERERARCVLNRMQARGRAGLVRVVAAAPAEVAGLLPAGDIGLLLRERNVTNRVAFPNKFAEYIRSGLVVVTSPGLEGPAGRVREAGLGVLMEPGAAAEPDRATTRQLATLLSRRGRDWAGWYRHAQQALAGFGDVEVAVTELARQLAPNRTEERSQGARGAPTLGCAFLAGEG